MNAEKKEKVAVVVVHGVGYHEPGASADAVSELLLGLRAREDGSTYAPFTAETIHVPLKPLEIRQPLRGGLVQAKPRFLSFLQERTVYLTTAWRERKAPERLQAEGKEKSAEVANDFMRLLLEDYRGAGEKNSPKSADDSTAYQTTCLVGGRRAGADAGGTTRPSGKPSEAEATAASPGGERIITNTCSQNYKFEGKERDTESGNDDFGARYYSSRLGRWLSADWSSVPVPVPYANLSNPQTLNLYAMVSDNPETFADLDGHCGQVVAAGAPTANVSVPCDGNPNSPANGANAAPAGNNAQQTGTGVGQSDAQKAATPPPPPPAQQQQTTLTNVTYNETGSLNGNPKATPGANGSVEQLHTARVEVAEVAERVLESTHPERVQASGTLTAQTQTDLAAGNKRVIEALNDSRSAARSGLGGSNLSHGAMHYRTSHHIIHKLYGERAVHFGPFRDALGGKTYIMVAP